MIFNKIAYDILICLFLTVVIEMAFALLLGVRSVYGQLVVLLVNTVTNPLLNCCLTVVCFYLSQRLYYAFLIPLEILIVFVEGAVYKRFLTVKFNPFLLSFLLNACSYSLGSVLLKILM